MQTAATQRGRFSGRPSADASLKCVTHRLGRPEVVEYVKFVRARRAKSSNPCLPANFSIDATQLFSDIPPILGSGLDLLAHPGFSTAYENSAEDVSDRQRHHMRRVQQTLGSFQVITMAGVVGRCYSWFNRELAERLGADSSMLVAK